MSSLPLNMKLLLSEYKREDLPYGIKAGDVLDRLIGKIDNSRAQSVHVQVRGR